MLDRFLEWLLRFKIIRRFLEKTCPLEYAYTIFTVTCDISPECARLRRAKEALQISDYDIFRLAYLSYLLREYARPPRWHRGLDSVVNRAFGGLLQDGTVPEWVTVFTKEVIHRAERGAPPVSWWYTALD